MCTTTPLVDRNAMTARIREVMSEFHSISANPGTSDEKVLGWLSTLRSIVSDVESRGNDALDSDVLGVDRSDARNFVIVCKDAVRTLASTLTSIRPSTAYELLTYANSNQYYRRIDNCYVWHDFVSHKTAVWDRFLHGLIDAKDLQMLEIGSYEGLSASWMLTHILTNEDSRLVSIDLCSDQIALVFEANLARIGCRHKVERIRARSQDALRAMSGRLFDVIYIDGSHDQIDLLEDAVLSWRLLKPCGVMIFDDYGLGHGLIEQQIYALYPQFADKPEIAIDAFLKVYGRELDLLHKGYQVLVRKRVTSA